MYRDADGPARRGLDCKQGLDVREAREPHPQPLSIRLNLGRPVAVDHVHDAARDATLAAIEKEQPLERRAMLDGDLRGERDRFPHAPPVSRWPGLL
jgi:hypothetical protein